MVEKIEQKMDTRFIADKIDQKNDQKGAEELENEREEALEDIAKKTKKRYSAKDFYKLTGERIASAKKAIGIRAAITGISIGLGIGAAVVGKIGYNSQLGEREIDNSNTTKQTLAYKLQSSTINHQHEFYDAPPLNQENYLKFLDNIESAINKTSSSTDKAIYLRDIENMRDLTNPADINQYLNALSKRLNESTEETDGIFVFLYMAAAALAGGAIYTGTVKTNEGARFRRNKKEISNLQKTINDNPNSGKIYVLLDEHSTERPEMYEVRSLLECNKPFMNDAFDVLLQPEALYNTSDLVRKLKTFYTDTVKAQEQDKLNAGQDAMSNIKV